jgi:predicted DNA-binding transcriptional regulator AlpA
VSAHSSPKSGTPARSDAPLSPASTRSITVPATDVLLRAKQIVGDPDAGIPALIPISRAKLYADMAAGKFPKPDVRLGARTVMWKLSTVTRFIAEQSEQAGAA